MFRILIVDDDKNSRRYYHAILSHSGYQPTCADSASIALHMLEEKDRPAFGFRTHARYGWIYTDQNAARLWK